MVDILNEPSRCTCKSVWQFPQNSSGTEPMGSCFVGVPECLGVPISIEYLSAFGGVELSFSDAMVAIVVAVLKKIMLAEISPCFKLSRQHTAAWERYQSAFHRRPPLIVVFFLLLFLRFSSLLLFIIHYY